MSIALVTRGSSHFSRQVLFRTPQLLIRRHAHSSTTPELSTKSDGPFVCSGKSETKKNFALLPKVLVLEDGNPVEALPPFDGGLKQPRKPRKKREATTDELKITSKKSKETAPTRKGRKKSLTTTLAKEDETLPKTRRRKVAPTLDSALGDDPSEITPKIPDEDGLAETRRGPRTQLAREVLENISKFPHCILLTRVGQFYESYFDPAQEVSSLLSIKLAKRTWDGQRVWMCGFPLMHLDKHLKTLVQQHKRSVALCEEFQRPRDPLALINSKPSFDRRVVRVLTPGTLIDETFLNPYENNYLLAIGGVGSGEPELEDSSEIGLAWIDVSTGEFFTRSAQLSTLKDCLVRIDPREVVIDKSPGVVYPPSLMEALKECDCLISHTTMMGTPRSTYSGRFDTDDNVVDDPNLQTVFTLAESSAIDLLTHYLHNHLLEHNSSSLQPARENTAKRMQIDAHTLKALEIKEGIREGGTTGSLMSAVKRTVTGSGTRLLSRWLCSPSTSLEEIKARQDLVDLFYNRPSLRADIIEKLKCIEDASRITQKFLLGRGKTDDLVAIQHTIENWNIIKRRISLEKSVENGGCQEHVLGSIWKNPDSLLSRIADLQHLSKRIEQAVEARDIYKPSDFTDEAEDILDPGLSSSTALELSSKIYNIPGADMKWTIKPQFSPELSSLHVNLRQLLDKKDELERKLQDKYNAQSLTLRSSPSHGVHVHLSKGRRDAEMLNRSRRFNLLAENNSTKTYFNQEWFVLGNSILETVVAILSAEKQAFLTLREEVVANSNAIRRNARVFDELDVTTSFATLAGEMNFVRPNMTEDLEYRVVNGRHPTVEQGLFKSGRPFTPNTVHMTESSKLQIITGPNMAGKSTFLRQTALIAILAQAGSFVPADEATIGLVDKVFSRVGAKDDLFRDRSTFMVEMLETGEILRNATSKSLVIMDEVGRGTTTHDGLAIAFATICHLYYKNECRALFATHFHEVADMMSYSEKTSKSDLFCNAGFFCTDLVETEDDHFAYSYRLKSGVNRDSHGLKVAKLGGLPPLALDIAQNALCSLKQAQMDDGGQRQHLEHMGKSIVERKLLSNITQCNGDNV